ncbi:hypothetical protein SAMN05216360_11046 [Methylobacterium phyllostachyos]|uniref:DUF2946 domain-containing protein n=1 Tax=Methylobacterium phyllostachyos TaxID=582672 RepID=A0A1H0D6T2_9HYPH|nr:hypothetical protein [Methylobacterium phyllostachyos]SDN65900.1 hypothetical protein SAMN05216360_11046 [Methylobacterium phyllostachyos]
MTFGVRHRRSARARGWWALAVRMLALVLALSVAGPGVSLAADLAFHAGGHHEVGEGAALDAPTASTAVDPGLAAHVHCSCHLAARLEAAAMVPPPVTGRPLRARLAQGHSSIAPDRLPRPPRA